MRLYNIDRYGLSDGCVGVTLWLVPVSLVLNRGEYGATAWCREALTNLRTLVEQTWPLESSEIAGLGVKLGID